MSVKVMSLIWDRYPNGGGEFLTALCLADHADHEGGNIFPSVARVAAKTQQNERTVQRHLAAMRDSGWLVVVKEASGVPGQATSYRIPVEAIPPDVVGRVTKLHPYGWHLEHGRVTNQAQTGDTAMSPKLGLPVIKSNHQLTRRQAPRRSRSLEAHNKAAGEEWLRREAAREEQ